MLRWRSAQIAALTVPHMPALFDTLAPLAGEVAFLAAAKQRRAVLANLSHLFPNTAPLQRDSTARGIFRSVARYYVELMRLPALSLASQRRRLRVRDYQNFIDAAAFGRGVIIAGIHIGPAEMVLQGFPARGVPYIAMIERLQPEPLAELLMKVRTAHGQEFVYPDLAGTKRLIRALRSGGLVTLLVDRDVTGSGVAVEFCGSEIHVPAGVMALARLSHAPIVPAVPRWLPRASDRHMEVTLLQPFWPELRPKNRDDLRRETERLLARFEPHLRRYPEQWLVLQRLWGG